MRKICRKCRLIVKQGKTRKMTEHASPGPASSSPDWSAMTAERAYYKCGGIFVKRSLLPHERPIQPNGTPFVPSYDKARLQNEATSLNYIRKHTKIPVPKVYAAFENHGCYFLITEFIDGVQMSQLPESQKRFVKHELVYHLASLRGLRSKGLGNAVGVIPPYRVMANTGEVTWSLRSSSRREYVFCHNDLGQQNILVDPQTLKIKAIIDWEYAGFFPAAFEGAFYNRAGPSFAIRGERNDVPELIEFLQSRQSESRQVQ